MSLFMNWTPSMVLLENLYNEKEISYDNQKQEFVSKNKFEIIASPKRIAAIPWYIDCATGFMRIKQRAYIPIVGRTLPKAVPWSPPSNFIRASVSIIIAPNTTTSTI